MSVLLAALIAGAAANMAGSLFSTAANYSAQKQANKTNLAMNEANNLLQQQLQDKTMAFNADEAEKQRQWETDMSNTEVQRRMADMQAAGINPLMAANYGASTPTGYAAQGTSAFTSAGKVQAPHLDMSGFTNAMQSINNVLFTQMLANNSKTVSNIAKDPKWLKDFKKNINDVGVEDL